MIKWQILFSIVVKHYTRSKTFRNVILKKNLKRNQSYYSKCFLWNVTSVVLHTLVQVCHASGSYGRNVENVYFHSDRKIRVGNSFTGRPCRNAFLHMNKYTSFSCCVSTLWTYNWIILDMNRHRWRHVVHELIMMFQPKWIAGKTNTTYKTIIVLAFFSFVVVFKF